MRKCLQIIFLVLLVSITFISEVYSQNRQEKSYYAQALSTFKYEDNVLRSKFDKRSDSIMEVSPKISFTMYPFGTKFSTAYGGKIGRHVTYLQQDYLHHNLSAEWEARPSSVLNVKLLGSYIRNQETLGDTGIDASVDDSPNVFERPSGEIKILYRNGESRASFEFSVQIGMLRYKKSDLSTNDTDSMTYKFLNGYQWTGKTRVYYSISRTNSRYVNKEAFESDNTASRYLVGAEWKSSGKTVSFIETGLATQAFVNEEISSTNDINISSSLVWHMRSYSQISLNLSRNTQSTSNSEFLTYVRNRVDISWQHGFNNRLASVLSFDATLNQTNDNESEFFYTLTPSLNYQLTRWASVASQMSLQSKKSTIENSEYDLFVFTTSINLMLR